jgi:hypothetical protein
MNYRNCSDLLYCKGAALAEPSGNAQGGPLNLVGALYDCVGVDALPSTLDLMNAGIVLTDATCRIVHVNMAAEQLMDGGALLCIEDMLSARHARSAAELHQAITDAAAGTAPDSPKGGTTVVAKGIGGPDLAVWVLPLDGGLRRTCGGSFEASVAVFIRRLGDTCPLPPRFSATAAR